MSPHTHTHTHTQAAHRFLELLRRSSAALPGKGLQDPFLISKSTADFVMGNRFPASYQFSGPGLWQDYSTLCSATAKASIEGSNFVSLLYPTEVIPSNALAYVPIYTAPCPKIKQLLIRMLVGSHFVSLLYPTEDILSNALAYVPIYTASCPKIKQLLIRMLVGSNYCVYVLRKDMLIDITWIVRGTL